MCMAMCVQLVLHLHAWSVSILLLACPGVRGIVLEAFGVGNFPDLPQQGWVPWLRQQTRKGLQVRARQGSALARAVF